MSWERPPGACEGGEWVWTGPDHSLTHGDWEYTIKTRWLQGLRSVQLIVRSRTVHECEHGIVLTKREADESFDPPEFDTKVEAEAALAELNALQPLT